MMYYGYNNTVVNIDNIVTSVLYYKYINIYIYQFVFESNYIQLFLSIKLEIVLFRTVNLLCFNNNLIIINLYIIILTDLPYSQWIHQYNQYNTRVSSNF